MAHEAGGDAGLETLRAERDALRKELRLMLDHNKQQRSSGHVWRELKRHRLVFSPSEIEAIKVKLASVSERLHEDHASVMGMPGTTSGREKTSIQETPAYVTVRFPKKPDLETRSKLKAAGFRFLSKDKLWSAPRGARPDAAVAWLREKAGVQ